MLLEVQAVCVSLPLFLVCVLLLKVNLCEAAAAISGFICRQVWQPGGSEEGGEAGGGEKDGGGEKEGEQ